MSQLSGGDGKGLCRSDAQSSSPGQLGHSRPPCHSAGSGGGLFCGDSGRGGACLTPRTRGVSPPPRWPQRLTCPPGRGAGPARALRGGRQARQKNPRRFRLCLRPRRGGDGGSGQRPPPHAWLRSWCHGAAVGQSGHLSAVMWWPVQFFPTSGEGTSVVDPHLGVWFPQLQRAGQTRGPSQQGTPSRRKAIWVGEATRVASPTPVAAPSCHVALRTLPEDCRWPLRAALPPGGPPGPPDSGGSGAGTQLDPWDAAPPKAWGARGAGPAWRQVRLQASGGGAALGRDAGRDRRRGRARPRGLV